MANLPTGYQGRGQMQPARVQSDPSLNGNAIIGRGIGEAGDMLARAAGNLRAAEDEAARIERAQAEREERERLAAANAAAGADYATSLSQLQLDIQALRESSPPGAPEHDAKVDEAIAKWQDNLTGKWADPRVAQQWMPDLARAAGQLKLSERAWSAKQRGEKLTGDFATYRDAQANMLLTGAPSAADVQAAKDSTIAFLGTQNLPPPVRDALIKETSTKYDLAAFGSLRRRDPRAALQLIDAGGLNAIGISPEQLQVLRNGVESDVAQLGVQEEKAKGAQIAELRQSADVTLANVADGVEVDSEALRTMAAQATAAGDEPLARRLGEALVRNEANKRYGEATIIQKRQAVREIEGTKGWREKPELVIMHDQLGKLIQADETQGSKDPLALYVRQSGVSLPPFNLADPSSVQRWARAGIDAAKMYGGQAHVMPEEIAAPLRQQFASGGAGDKANAIGNFGAYGRQVGGMMLRQVTDASPGYAVLLDLATMKDRGAGNRTLREALSGWDQLKANDKLWDKNAAELTLRGEWQGALQLLPGVAKQGVLEVAKGIYAQRAATRGVARFDRGLYGEALADALGRAGPSGGVGTHPSGAKVILPRGMTEGVFETVLARAQGKEFVAASGDDIPTWGNRDITDVNQVKGLIPVLVTDDNGKAVYAFRTRNGGFLGSKRHPGQNYVLDAWALGRLVQGRMRGKR